MATDPTHRALVESINHVGHVMHIKTIAESVEHPRIAEILRDMKVDYAQGYCFSTPEPIERILQDHDSEPQSSESEVQTA
jgi:EAL domain-containing protein (putative c-di-GMP-specific phosphodiesterase class I)